eukprot:symbB.v1.2.032712.t1/scaffold3962.1/size79057/6
MAPVSRLAIALNLEPPNAVLLKRYRHLLQESALPEPDLRTQHWRPEIEVPFRGPETEVPWWARSMGYRKGQKNYEVLRVL